MAFDEAVSGPVDSTSILALTRRRRPRPRDLRSDHWTQPHRSSRWGCDSGLLSQGSQSENFGEWFHEFITQGQLYYSGPGSLEKGQWWVKSTLQVWITSKMNWDKMFVLPSLKIYSSCGYLELAWKNLYQSSNESFLKKSVPKTSLLCLWKWCIF